MKSIGNHAEAQMRAVVEHLSFNKVWQLQLIISTYRIISRSEYRPTIGALTTCVCINPTESRLRSPERSSYTHSGHSVFHSPMAPCRMATGERLKAGRTVSIVASKPTTMIGTPQIRKNCHGKTMDRLWTRGQ